jgi:hypothetical protein
MTENLIYILKQVKERFTDSSDMLWTSYETAKEVRDELDVYIEHIKIGDKTCLDNLNMHFLPASTFQEHSLQNGWSKDYMILSDKFDSIYAKIKNHS